MDKIIRKMFFSALLTTALMEFSQVGAALIDGAITAKALGAEAVAAVGLAKPFYSICGVLSGCLAVGLRSLATREMGQGNTARLNRIFSEATSVGFAASVVLQILFWVFAPQLAVLFGARGNAAELQTMTVTYLRGLSLGALPFIMGAILSPAVQLDDGQAYVRVGSVAMAVSDIVFDLLAVKLGWGVWGVGLATSLSNWVNFLVILARFLRKDRLLHFRLCRISGADILKIAGLGTECVVRRSANILRPLLINALLVAVGGSMAVTVNSIRNDVLDFVKIIPSGISGGTALLMSLFYGEANEENIRATGKYVHRFNNRISLVVIALGLVLCRPIAIFYLGRDSELLNLLSFSIACTFVQSYFTSLTLSRVAYLQSLRKIRQAQVLTMSLNLIYVVGFAYLLNAIFGLYGIMASGIVSEFLVLVSIAVLYHLPRFRGENDDNVYLCTDKSLEIGPGDVISLEIRNEEDASLLSEQIQLFCKGHKLEQHTGYFAGLCAEEMALLSLRSGGKTQPTVHIRVVISDGKLVLRFRDNAKLFNITKLAEQLSDDADEETLGLRIITAQADDIQYFRTLESNNTLIFLKI